MSRASNLAGFTTSITSTRNLNIGIVTASEYDIFGSSNTLTVGGLSVGVSTFSGIATHTAALFGTQASFTGIVTASGFVGNVTGTATNAQGLTGTPNITVGNIIGSGLTITGISTANDRRILSVAEKTTRINGNTASLVYNTGGGNIAICTNPTGDITLAVTGIPTDTSFNDNSITFSVFINQTGTARSCTAITLNGLSATIRWAGGSLTNAVSGTGTSLGMDIYSFTGINTVGSASTTANYYVLGSVNGGYR